jgi:hypothetical protein
MFELIKIIVEKIADSFSPSAIKKYANDRKLSELGSELFLLYSSLNSITVTGRRIVDQLRYGVEALEGKLSEGRTDFVWYVDELPDLLAMQRISLMRFSTSLKRLGTHLQVIDGKAFREIVPLIYGKMNAVKTMVDLLAQRDPRLITIDDAHARALLFQTEDRSSVNRNDDTIGEAFSSERYAMCHVLDESALPISSALSQHNYEPIRDYLASRNPELELDAIDSIADRIRDAIAKNFSISEILLHVGDRRLLARSWDMVSEPHT